MDIDLGKTCPTPNGRLLVIGGHEDRIGKPEKKLQETDFHPMEILEKFISLTGKKNPAIEVVTTAADDGKDMFGDYKKAFKQLCIASPGQIHHNSRADVLNADLDSRIQKADGVFFTGGDQLKLTSIYGGTKLLFELKKRYIYDGLVLAGTSAGAMALSTPMIFAGNTERQQLVGEISITTGLEFLKDVCIDTHFVDRGRFVRMAQVIVTNPTCIGIGIEEDTAIIVRGGKEIEVLGSGTVIIIEGFGITGSNIMEYESGKAIAIQDLNVKLLSKGSTYSIPMVNPPHL